MRRIRSFLAICTMVWMLITHLPVGAQAPGFADITHPQSGEVLLGVVTIEGSAAHPAFVAYELTFAYDPNPTDTWFPIVDYIQTSVTDGRLGLWDTTNISDGEYQLRLRVLLNNESSLEAYARGLRVRNTSPTETQAVVQEEITSTPAVIQVTDTPTSTTLTIPRTPGDEKLHALRPLTIGGGFGVLVLSAFAMYTVVRKFRRSRHAVQRFRKSAVVKNEIRPPDERNS